MGASRAAPSWDLGYAAAVYSCSTSSESTLSAAISFQASRTATLVTTFLLPMYPLGMLFLLLLPWELQPSAVPGLAESHQRADTAVQEVALVFHEPVLFSIPLSWY